MGGALPLPLIRCHALSHLRLGWGHVRIPGCSMARVMARDDGARDLPALPLHNRPASRCGARPTVMAEKDIAVDVAVLGGGPGGYTAAIRAAQLGASVACIEREAVLGGTCLRVGCIPTKAWVQTALFLKQADETFAKLGVHVEGIQLDFHKANGRPR